MESPERDSETFIPRVRETNFEEELNDIFQRCSKTAGWTTKLTKEDTPKSMQGLRIIRVPIDRLAHVTHEKVAKEIEADGIYRFKAKQKFGRTGNGSFKLDGDRLLFLKVDSKALLFEGHYSWWSPYVHEYDIPNDHPKKKFCIAPPPTIEGTKIYVADYIKTPPKSPYGNIIFSCRFEHLLNAYAKSRQHDVGNICIKSGGVLRYKNEVCYVFIISIESDALPFPQVDDDDKIFEINQLTENGKVINPEKIPTFWPKNIVTWYDHKTYSYITAAFAFYYKDANNFLEVEQSKCEQGSIIHEYCLKKVPVWVCPNELK